MNTSARILLAEDEPVVSAIIEDILVAEGYTVVACGDGHSAWEQLRGNEPQFDLILLDRLMPGMDGMALLRGIKADARLARIPVIMETAMEDQNSVREGLDAGAYYYLTKPFRAEVLLAIVHAALSQLREYRQLRDSVRAAERPAGLLVDGVFRFRDVDEARLLAAFLARAYPDAGKVVHGLQELLVNAVEHGNLGVTYAEKGALLLDGRWDEELTRRHALPEYRDRRVEVGFARGPGAIRVTIRDQGDGFDWESYLQLAPERAFDLHGRGIAMARMLSFDRLEYLGNGNTVVATVNLPAQGAVTGDTPDADAGTTAVTSV